jgi:two-component system, chemotaxis family, sensor kinase Cph1
MQRDQRFWQLFEESRDPAFILDPIAERILAANRAGCALLGYTRQELLATPVARIHPADLPQLREFVSRVLEHGQGSTIKLTCRTKSGTFLPVEMALFSFGNAGHPRILGLLHDRSEHRQPGPATEPR